MSDVAWNTSIRGTGIVKVDVTNVNAPGWKSATAAAIRDLNNLLAAHKIKVQLKTGDSAVIVVALAAGAYSFPVDGKTVNDTLASGVPHGATHGIDRESYGVPEREKAYVFLPLSPRVSSQDPKSRAAGEPVLRVIAAHEFLHALGLVEHDPNFEGLFAKSIVINEGRKPEQDTASAFGSKMKMPPIKLSATTVSRLRDLW